MMKDMKDSREIFFEGIDNLHVIGKPEQFGKKNSAQMMMFYFLLCLLSRRQVLGKRLFLINGMAEKGRKRPNAEHERIYARRFSSKIADLIKETSIVTPLSRIERFVVIIKAMLNAPRDRRLLGRWIEFNLLKATMQSVEISEVASFGHYDELTYWLSELCRISNISYKMYQHGIVKKSISIPNKVYCQEIHVYNNYSKEVFREKIIRNSDCIYSIDGFETSIVFRCLEKEQGKKYIGIIDQTFPEWLEFVASSVLEISGYVAVIMLHPLNNEFIYRKKKNDVIITKEKYENLDCIISDYSTLILDYIFSGYNKPIICTNKEAIDTIFKEYDLLYVKKEDLKYNLRQIVERESNK